LLFGAGQPEVPRDQHALDLAGPFPDLQNLRVPVEPRHRELLDETVPTVDLHRLAGAGHGELGGVDLRDAGLRLERTTLVPQPRGPVDVGPGGLRGDLHVGQLELQPLERTYGPPEGDPLLRVREALLET